MTVKNPDADASEWHAQNARSDTPRTQGVSPLTRSGHLRHRLRAAGTLTLAGPGPRVCLRVVMSTLPIRTRRWTRREYDRLVELGVLHEDEPIELVDGQMVDDESEPEPDVSVVRGAPRDYLGEIQRARR